MKKHFNEKVPRQNKHMREQKPRQATLTTQISRRKKLEKNPNNPKHLVTESGVGYRFV